MGALEVSDVKVHFGAVRAVDGVSLVVQERELVGLVGPNGSGKTTLLKAVCGAAPVVGGSIRWDGVELASLPTHRRAQLGVVRTFQHPTPFPSATVRTSIRMAVACANGVGRHRSRAAALPTDADELLEFSGLTGEADTMCGALPAGLLRKVGVVLALAISPRLVLLDEPAAGLNTNEKSELGELLVATRAAGVTVVVVDHDMHFLFPLVDRMVVLDAGKVLAQGTPSEIGRNPAVVRVYLGNRFAAAAAAGGGNDA